MRGDEKRNWPQGLIEGAPVKGCPLRIVLLENNTVRRVDSLDFLNTQGAFAKQRAG